MTRNDTSLGGGAAAFPDTQWSVVRHFQSPEDYRTGMASLGQRYWKPVYSYLRIGLARTNEDAKDLTQAFFLWLFESAPLKAYDADKGSFRTFLKVLLRRFAGHEAEAMARLKRGGGQLIVSLDAADLAADPKALDPEQAFDRAWLNALMANAVARVARRLRNEGRDIQFRVFEALDLSEGDKPTYAEAATRLGIKETDISNHLHAVRKVLAEAVREELGQLTADEAGRDAEWNELMGP